MSRCAIMNINMMLMFIPAGDILDGFQPRDGSEAALTRILSTLDASGLPHRHMLGNHCLYNLPRERLNERLGISGGCGRRKDAPADLRAAQPVQPFLPPLLRQLARVLLLVRTAPALASCCPGRV